jgi:hypothetical protein
VRTEEQARRYQRRVWAEENLPSSTPVPAPFGVTYFPLCHPRENEVMVCAVAKDDSR